MDYSLLSITTDKDAVSIHEELNSLKFAKDGHVYEAGKPLSKTKVFEIISLCLEKFYLEMLDKKAQTIEEIKKNVKCSESTVNRIFSLLRFYFQKIFIQNERNFENVDGILTKKRKK
jgi:hypothetical protein